jgi:hypothetical protein
LTSSQIKVVGNYHLGQAIGQGKDNPHPPMLTNDKLRHHSA